MNRNESNLKIILEEQSPQLRNITNQISNESARQLNSIPKSSTHFFDKLSWNKTCDERNSDEIKDKDPREQDLHLPLGEMENSRNEKKQSLNSPKILPRNLSIPKIRMSKFKNEEEMLKIGTREKEEAREIQEKENNEGKIVTFFAMLGKIIHFLRKIKQRIAYSDISNLTLLQLHIIDDKSHSITQDFMKTAALREDTRSPILRKMTLRASFKRSKILEKLVGFSKHTIGRIPVFHPLSRPLIAWKALLCLLILFEIFSISINLFFRLNWDADYPFTKPYETVLKTCLLIDLLVVFNTGIFKSGAVIYRRKEVVVKYVRKGLVLDTISLAVLFVPFFGQDIEFSSPGLLFTYKNIFKFLFFFRMHQISKVYKYLEELLFYDEFYEGLLSLFKLFCQVLMISHLIACTWNFCAVFETKNQKETWLSKVLQDLNLNQVDWSVQYLYAWYFSLTTMITVGYGDISPKNDSEVVIASVAMLFGCGFFAYAISSIGIIVEKFSQKEKNLRKDLRVINKYMTKKDVDFELQVRIRKYLEHIWLEEEIENRELEAQIMTRLSDSLREELLIQSNGKVLAKFNLFNNFFTPETLEKVSQIVNTVSYAPDDIIIYDGEPSNNIIYFIIKGEVEIFQVNQRNEKQTTLKTLKMGDCFGQLSFFTECERSFNAKSADFCTLFTLRREDFLQIIKSKSEDFENFHLIKDNITLYNDISKLEISCESCSSSKHTIKECPFLRYSPNKDLLIRKHLFSEPNQRKACKRKRSKSTNSLLFLNYYKDYFQQNESEREINSISEVSDNIMNMPANGDSPSRKTLMLNESGEKDLERNYSIDLVGQKSPDSGLTGFTGVVENKSDEELLYTSKKKFTLPKKAVNFSNIWADEASIEMQPKRKLTVSTVLQKNSNDMESKESYRPKQYFKKSTSTSTKRGLTVLKENLPDSQEGTEKTTVSHQNHEQSNIAYFDKELPLIFGGLNIDTICTFTYYFPYNNCKYVLEFIERFRKRTEQKSNLTSHKTIIKSKKGAEGLIEFRNQQRYFLKNKQHSSFKSQSKTKSPKRGRSVFKKMSNILFSNAIKNM